MLFRSSISNTRRLFKKTLENFKSFFSNGYQKLPESPTNTSINKPCSDLTFYISQNNKTPPSPNIIISSSSPSSSLHKQLHAKPRSPAETPKKQRKTEHEQTTLCSTPKIQLVRQRLKELETMIGVMSDRDHVSDVQEFLHYYSRLRCPAYLDMVEQFLMEIYSEFFVPQLQPQKTPVDSRRRKTVVGSNGR